MAATVSELSAQMVQQLRLLDPSVSAEVGTPERKILDTVASALSNSQIDLIGLQGALDLDSKYGGALDRFLALFGFARQKATYATGYVTLSRPEASTLDIRIPGNTQIQAPETDDIVQTTFYTTQTVTLIAGATSIPVPIRAAIAGQSGNVPANSITQISGQNIIGITAVNNELPTTGGVDAETDNELKIRFKNTVFRNLAGTQDQYLALAIATAYTTKVNVIGPQSRYREYIQVPPVADNASYDYSGDGYSESGNGLSNQYSTALSSNPFAQAVYTNYPVFISNGDFGPASVFFREGVDFRLNILPSDRNRGDAYRAFIEEVGANPADPLITSPSVTFTNVYVGTEGTIEAIRPNGVVLLEYAYMSEFSRNNLTENVTNAVDVFIDGGNETQASTVVSPPSASGIVFLDNYNQPGHYENYRRQGEPLKRPIVGNFLTPLFFQPVLSLPDSIIIGPNEYIKGQHYWLVEDRSSIGGTVRGRSGIEWNPNLKGKLTGDPLAVDPAAPAYTGALINNAPGSVEIEDYTFDKNIVDLQGALEASKQITTDVLAHSSVSRYFKLDITVMYSPGSTFSDVNASINTEVNNLLARQYYGSTVQLSDLLQAVHNVPGVDNARWTSDVPNVNPSFAPNAAYAQPRVIECDAFGKPLNWVDISSVIEGVVTLGPPSIQWLFIPGEPMTEEAAQLINAGLHSRFTLKLGNTLIGPIDYDTDVGTDVSPATSMAARIKTAFGNAGISLDSTPNGVVEDTRSTTGVRIKARSFRIRFFDEAPQSRIEVADCQLFGGPTQFRNDFYLRDNEVAQLPTAAFTPPSGVADTVPGLIIRPRAQNTWARAV